MLLKKAKWQVFFQLFIIEQFLPKYKDSEIWKNIKKDNEKDIIEELNQASLEKYKMVFLDSMNKMGNETIKNLQPVLMKFKNIEEFYLCKF